MKVEATVGTCKCASRHKLFGIRFEKVDQDQWELTWAFKMEEKAAKREGYGNTVIKGNLRNRESYPGCPYCGNQNFFICGRCGKLTCLSSEWDAGTVVTCEWCGNKSKLSAYDGSGIESGEDR